MSYYQTGSRQELFDLFYLHVNLIKGVYHHKTREGELELQEELRPKVDAWSLISGNGENWGAHHADQYDTDVHPVKDLKPGLRFPVVFD